MKNIFITSLFLFFSCGPQYVKDPNANVLVTVKYEDGPIKIVNIPGETCNKQYDCKEKKGAECAAALYNASGSFIEEGKKLYNKKLYLSAKLAYIQAMTRLSEAEIRLNKAKADNYEDWKIAVLFGLEKKIKDRIKFCQKQIYLLKWKR